MTTMVIQIQAGGVGLNLQCASKVYITAPEWNPVLELQAISRVHRLHQKRDVRCTRVVMAGTVEELACMRTEADKLGIIAECLGDHDGCADRKMGHDGAAFTVRRMARRLELLRELFQRDGSVPGSPGP
jgi:hypothetical protein